MVDRVADQVDRAIADREHTKQKREEVKAVLFVRRPELRGLSDEEINEIIADAEDDIWHQDWVP